MWHTDFIPSGTARVIQRVMGETNGRFSLKKDLMPESDLLNEAVSGKTKAVYKLESNMNWLMLSNDFTNTFLEIVLENFSTMNSGLPREQMI